MQILEHGNKALIITCSCGCKFIYDAIDVITTIADGIYTYYVICPECNEVHPVTLSIIK